MRRELEIYLHIPFCVKKCEYCDFLSAPASEAVREEYVQCLIREIEAFSWSEQYQVSTVFFGGGTPSLLSAAQVIRILEALRRRFLFAQGAEITLECNPGTADGETLAGYCRAGVNRLSIGLQSANGEELRLLGRIHTWEQFLRTYEAARKAGFSNISLDLMAALPGQTVRSWEHTLGRVLALAPEHISAYSLMIEEGTPFYARYHEDDERRARGEPPLLLPSEEEEREMYRMTEERLRGAGLFRYEISNYARPGFACRHNLGYWTGVEYAGFGIGAASLLNHVRYRSGTQLAAYLERWKEAPTGFQAAAGDARKLACSWKDGRETTALTQKDEIEEFMFLGLRLTEGISCAEFERRFHRSWQELYGETSARLARLGLLEQRGDQVRLTSFGCDVSNQVLAEFLLDDR